FAVGNSSWYRRESEPWKIYAFTDRPAYRPKETVNWKFIARQYDGANYSTPANRKIEFEITDARGAKVKSDTVALNMFGSAWGALELTEQMPLGEYRVQFWDEGRHKAIGEATLFRLEEYKLPEFKVTVQTPEEQGPDKTTRRKAFRLGEKVEATIQADYYFGGPVANATVEVIVRQTPFWHLWPEPRPYPWLYQDMNEESSAPGRYRSFGGEQIVKRETLKTDATGKATITFETPANNGQDLEFQIEARVTDSSRREIVGHGSVRATRQRYYVKASADHNLYRPQDKVQIEFKALDANEQPVQTTGTVKVTRDFWFEIWLAPDGHEVKGDELKRRQAASKIWPPVPERPDQKGWRLKFRGYEHDDILTRTLKTYTNGLAELTFTPEREGYYRVAWTSDDEIRTTQYVSFTNQITAETTVWVANTSTSELGYRHDGVEIIVDKDTFRVGQPAPVMLVANTSDRYILFSVEGEDLYSYQLLHLDGTVKLIQLPIEEKHVPNIFLNATLVSDRQIFADTKQVVVPPTKNFLTVEIHPDRAQYQPRDEGTLTVTTRNDAGKPVSAEVALSLVDESVFYIQSDYAGDPRQFYFGTKRNQLVQSQSTFQQKSYAKLVEVEKLLIDERDKEARLRDEANEPAMFNYQLNGKDESGIVLGQSRMLSKGGRGVWAGDSLDQWVVNAAPAAASAPMGMVSEGAMANRSMAFKAALAPLEAAGVGEEPTVVARTDFRSTVLWQPNVVTGDVGTATV
ncbi:MAG: MG2 domain-containing protein, partial [Verrucomicrobiota bacterium]